MEDEDELPSSDKIPHKELDRAAVLRRAEFLLTEARSSNPIRDQSITYAMRVISNYVCVGRDLSAKSIKKRAKIMSRRAHALKLSMSEEEWFGRVINEHQEPLQNVWKWIIENNVTLKPEEILHRFAKWPMVVVSKEEDCLIRLSDTSLWVSRLQNSAR
jgi:hypothetical protein